LDLRAITISLKLLKLISIQPPHTTLEKRETIPLPNIYFYVPQVFSTTISGPAALLHQNGAIVNISSSNGIEANFSYVFYPLSSYSFSSREDFLQFRILLDSVMIGQFIPLSFLCYYSSSSQPLNISASLADPSSFLTPLAWNADYYYGYQLSEYISLSGGSSFTVSASLRSSVSLSPSLTADPKAIVSRQSLYLYFFPTSIAVTVSREQALFGPFNVLASLWTILLLCYSVISFLFPDTLPPIPRYFRLRKYCYGCGCACAQESNNLYRKLDPLSVPNNDADVQSNIPLNSTPVPIHSSSSSSS
jgi:hypothetical protein